MLFSSQSNQKGDTTKYKPFISFSLSGKAYDDSIQSHVVIGKSLNINICLLDRTISTIVFLVKLATVFLVKLATVLLWSINLGNLLNTKHVNTTRAYLKLQY